MNQQIVSRWNSSQVLFKCDVPSDVPSSLTMRYTLERAIVAKVNLSGANLSGSDFRGANLRNAELCSASLRGSDLSGANLSGSELNGINLCGANLRNADLSGSDLSSANLRGAELSSSDFRGACLRNADLSGSDLSGSDLTGSDLSRAGLCGAELNGAELNGAFLSGANLRGADGAHLPRATPAQAIENLDKVREIVCDDKARLNMNHWHSSDEWKNRTCAEETLCETTHCMAGWLQVCTTEPALKSVMPQLAGLLAAPIASKMFHRGNREVFEWLRDRKYVAESDAYEKRGAELKAKREAAKAAA